MCSRNLAIIHQTFGAHITTWGIQNNDVLTFITLTKTFARSNFLKKSGISVKIILLPDLEFKKEIESYSIKKALYCWGLLEILENL